MPYNLYHLLNSINGLIEVPSLYPYFCNLTTEEEFIQVMLQFLNKCKSDTKEGTWMWGIETPINASSSFSDWLNRWNDLSRYQTSDDDNNKYQSLIYKNKYDYILDIRETYTNNIIISYTLTQQEAVEVLRLMLLTQVYDQDYIFIES
jgi:hypothetical protein